MNKRYIDFVPPKQKKEEKPVPKKTRVIYRDEPRVVKAEPRVYRSETRIKREEPRTPARVVRQTPKAVASRGGFSIKDEPALGVIEDLNPKFVSAPVEKRPLGSGRSAEKRSDIREAKAKILVGRRMRKNAKSVEKSVQKPVQKAPEVAKNTAYKMPSNPFINQEKVVKRPLSKNVYQKKIAAPTEEAKGPVTIISKPEKDKNVSLVVTIIITIILGAAAGTVAFLLLPR